MKNKKYLVSMVLLGLMVQGTALAATTPVDAVDLGTEVVIGSRIKSTKVEVPANINVITAADIEKHAYTSVTDALRQLPGVMVMHDGNGGGEEYIQLNGNDRVLVLIDGVERNLAKGATSGRGGFDAGTLPEPSIIERIEVLKGAGTAMYGSNAVGGVINIITKRPAEDELKLDYARGNMNSYKYHGVASGRRGDWGFMVNGGTYHQKNMHYRDYATGSNKTLPASKWELDSLAFKVDKDISDDQLLTMHYQHTYKDGLTPGGVPEYPFAKPGARSEQLNNAFTTKYLWNKDEANTGSLTAAYVYYDGKYHGLSSYENTHYKEKQIGLELQQQIQTSAVNKLVFGGKYRTSRVSSTRYTDEHNLDNAALFLSNDWNINDNLLLNAGLRFDHHNSFGNKYTTAFGLNQKLNATSHVYLNYAQVFNAPQGNDLYWYETGMYGNPDLRAESGYNWTLGYSAEVTPKTTVGAHVFYNKLHDAIAWGAVDPTYVTSYDWKVMNVDEQKRRGLELSAQHQFDPTWSTQASYSYVKVESSTGGSAFERDYNYLPNQFKLGVNYNKAKWNADVLARAASGGAASKYLSSAYVTVDASTKYSMNDNWSLYGKVYNLTNATYTEKTGTTSGTYINPARGRFFMLGAQYKF